ncbi:MAG: RNA polymerase Rpb4 family protein [Desulfurococcaceae archaeon]
MNGDLLTTPLKVKVYEVRLISNSEALKYLKEYSERERSKTGTVPLLVQRVIEYLYKFVKIPPEKAEELREKLSSLNLKEETIVMLMNICPQSHDEIRPLLVLEEKVLEAEQLDRIANLLKEYCTE